MNIVLQVRRGAPKAIGLAVAAMMVAGVGVRAVPWAGATTSSGERAIFEPLPPARILDTRSPSNPMGPTESRVLQVTGAGGVPADATAVVLNVTAVAPTAGGWLTLYPADTPLPTASNVNFSAGQTAPNAVTVKLGSTGADVGKIKIYNSAGQTHVIVDVGGYFRGHDHDDRYHTRTEAQARTAANSLTCPAGQFLNTVAADGTPTCGVDTKGTTTAYRIAGPIGVIPAPGPGSTMFAFAGPTARVTTTAGQTVLASVSGAVGSTNSQPVWVGVCYASGGTVRDFTAVGNFLVATLQANVRQVVSTTLPIQLPAGSYDIGLCLRPSATLDNNDYVNGAVTVFG